MTERGVCSTCGKIIKWVWVDASQTVGHYVLAESTSVDRGGVCTAEVREMTVNGRRQTGTRELPHVLNEDMPAENASRDDLEAWLDS